MPGTDIGQAEHLKTLTNLPPVSICGAHTMPTHAAMNSNGLSLRHKQKKTLQYVLPLERTSKRQKDSTREGQTIIKVHVFGEGH